MSEKADSVIVFVQGIGDAPRLKQQKYRIPCNDRFGRIYDLLKQRTQSQQLFLYIQSSFCPSLDEKVLTLYQARQEIADAQPAASSSMQDAAPERITDLLRDEEFVYDEEDTAADMDADKAETPRAAAPQPQALQPARDRVPIPMPKRQGSGATLDRASPQRDGPLVPARPTGPSCLPEPSTCRYFIIKSNSEYNIKLSVQTGVWSTKRHNEQRLNDAFRSGAHVMLIFSYAGGGQFDGYAQMTSPAEGHRMATWENNMTMGGTFDLEWRRAYGLRWEDVQHLHNPLNEGKPVKISRDGQELPPDLGHTLLVMIEEGADRENIPPPPVPVRQQQQQQQPPQRSMQQGRAENRAPGGRGQQPRGFGRGGGQGMGMGPMGMGPMMPQMMPGMMMHGHGFPGMGPMHMMDPMMGGMMPMGMFPGAMGPMAGHRGGMMGMGMGGMGGMGMGNGMGSNPRPPPRPPQGPPPDGMRSGSLALGMGMAPGGSRRGPRDDEAPASRDSSGQIRVMEQQLAQMQRMLREAQRGEPRSEARSYGISRYRRSRSRSRSPGWRSRRSRSRSRSPRGHDLTSMSYDEYLDDFQRRARSSNRSSEHFGEMENMVNNVTRMIDQQRRVSGRPGGFNDFSGDSRSMRNADRGRTMGAGMDAGGMTADKADPTNMSEAEYVRMWQEYAAESNEPFDAVQVRGWYRSYQASRGGTG